MAAEALGSVIEERKLPGHRAALNGAIKATLRRLPGVSYAPLFDVPSGMLRQGRPANTRSFRLAHVLLIEGR